ncbi:MAG TPA: type-F conjugative transfer system secretin TraK [Alphaproteobacteria bacterium]|nr:type-F conjugative transfer system secretin TraK [Alphaproteobacteria bacterium]
MRLNFLALLSTISAAFSYSEVALFSKERVVVEVSKDSYTRLSVEGDPIKSFYCIDSLDVQEDADTGQLYINSLNAKEVPLTLSTESGYVGDITVVASKKGPQTVILKKNASFKKGHQGPLKNKEQQILKNTLAALLRGQNLEGFMTVSKEPTISLKGLKVEKYTCSMGSVLEAHVYDVKNTSSKEILLSSDDLRADFKGSIKAFHITTTHFKAAEQGKIVILSLR